MKTVAAFFSMILLVSVVSLTGCDNEDQEELERQTNEAANDIDEAASDVEDAADKAADDISDASRDAAQEVSDEALEKKVEVIFAAQDGFSGITVESRSDGIIVLTGNVATDAMKIHAQSVAENADGVKGVENRLVVVSKR